MESYYYREYLIQLACWQIGKNLIALNLNLTHTDLICCRLVSRRIELRLVVGHGGLDQRRLRPQKWIYQLGLAQRALLANFHCVNLIVLGAAHHDQPAHKN